MTKLKIAFFGAPSFAATVLQNIIDDSSLPVELKFVVTQPDRPSGRKQILTPTPVKLLAQKHSIPVFDDFRLSTFDFRLKELDLVLLYAFGEILPPEILKLPAQGFWNIHPSLLPKYRGTSPIAYALLMGDKTTGVSLMQMDERMDHGPLLAQRKYEIQSTDSRELLEKKLSSIGYELFKECILKLIDGSLERRTQNEELKTYTRLLTKQDGFIPFPLVQKILRNEPLSKDDIPPIIANYYKKYGVPPTFDFRLSTFDLYRAFSPWPGLWTLIRINNVEKRLKITRMSLLHPIITHVQLEGKKEVDIETFKKAYSHILNQSE